MQSVNYGAEYISKLFNLEPLGIGTGLVESLPGYIARLAENHGVTTGYLIDHEFAPFLEKIYLLNIAANGGTRFYANASMIVGVGKAAEEFVLALERLTLRRDLRHTTMLSWYDALPHRNLIRRNKCWCPVCYQERKEQELEIYDQLLWTLQGVKVCPRHKVRLQDTCPHCNQTMLLLERKSHSGYCSKCGHWLGYRIAFSLDGENSLLLQHASIAEKMISLAGQNQTSPSQVSILEQLRLGVEKFAQGNQAYAAKIIGVSKSTFAGWYSGSHFICFPQLLHIIHTFGIRPEEFFSVNIGFVSSSVLHKSIGKVSKRDSENLKISSKIEIKLREFAADPIPVSLRQASKLLSISNKTLKKYYPKLCSEISRRYKENCSKRASERQHSLECKVKDVTNQLLASNIYPSRRRVEIEFTSSGILHEKSLQKVWKSVLWEDDVI